MHFLFYIEHQVRYFAIHTPLLVFVFISSFLEEVISPIPSALIMGTAGSIALMQGKTLWFLFLLAIVGNLGKTLGAWFYYVIGDKLEDWLMPSAGKWFGFKQADVEKISKRFVGHHWKDGGILFLLRMIPPFPTTPVSIVAGIIKMDIRVFLLSTYAGNFLKDLVYLYIGYAGIARFHTLWRHFDNTKSVVNIVVVVLIIAAIFVFFAEKRKGCIWPQALAKWQKQWLDK